ncbi:hypothetical protein M0R45_024538 [Rubus argutus]|uniref:Uncharacterized protein n=1 Tax=Rubus argutus TaxID=59490 RepID=A0AAW1WTG8_RUBAR
MKDDDGLPTTTTASEKKESSDSSLILGKAGLTSPKHHPCLTNLITTASKPTYNQKLVLLYKEKEKPIYPLPCSAFNHPINSRTACTSPDSQPSRAVRYSHHAGSAASLPRP